MDVLAPPDILLFEGFCLDRRGGGLFRQDEGGVSGRVAIGSRALDVLGVLIDRRGDLLTREEIMTAAWPGTVVEDNNLAVQIAALRRLLDHDRKEGSCIQTVPGRGYRFVAPVTRSEPASSPVSTLPAGNGSSGLSAADGRPQDPGAAGQLGGAPPVPASRARSRLWGIIFATVIGALSLSAAVFTGLNWYSPRSGELRPTPRLSIVVLPFTNLSNDPDHQYFADGITEDLTTDMSRITGSFVISRNTAFTYRDKPVNVKQIGRELGVRYVLEGSVQRPAKQVRVSAQLIDAETDAHLWAERFDRDIGDLFALQNEITSRIAIALSSAMAGAEAARPTANPDALDYFFRGSAVLLRPRTRDSYAEAIRLFEHALALDPGSAEVQNRLAIALSSRVLDGMSDTRAADMTRAEGLVAQALTASPDTSLGHFAKGQMLRAQSQYAEAIPEYEAVIALNRNSPNAYANLGQCKFYTGSLEEVIPLVEQAIRLSPRDPILSIWYARIGQVHLLQSRTDEAILWFEKARSANPAHPGVRSDLAAAYGIKGESERAAAELAEARRLNGEPDASSSIARFRASRNFMAPKVRALYEATYDAGLRKAGMPEE